MHTRPLLRAALAGGFLALGVSTVHAQQQPLGTPSETVPVNYEIARPISPDCQALSHVEGTVSVVRPPRRADLDLNYRPNLTIRSRVTCGDGTVRQFAPRLLQSGEFSSEQLAQAISARGRFVSALQDAQVCTVMPVAHVDARNVTFRGMNASCTPMARGGGPPAGEPSWCVGADAQRDPGCLEHRER